MVPGSHPAPVVGVEGEAGKVPARQLHETLPVLLPSNFTAVTDADAWITAVESGQALPKSDLGTSAVQG